PTTNLVSDQLALMMEHFKKMTNAIDQISLEKTMVQLPSSSQSDDLKQMFQNITCSNDLYMLKYLEIVSWIPSHVYLILNLKKQALKHLLSTIKLSFGIFEFKNKNNFDESLRKFIDQIQVHMINYLGNLPPPNHSQGQALKDSNKMQVEHLEGKAQQIDENPSSCYSMAPSSLTPSNTTTSTKDNLGFNGKLLSSRMDLSATRRLYKAGQSEKFILDSLPASINKILSGHEDEVYLTRLSTQINYDEIDTDNEEFSLYKDESLDMNNDQKPVTSNMVSASSNMFQRTSTLQSSNSPCDSSNNQGSKRSLNNSNLGHIPTRMKHTQFQNTNAERCILGLPDFVSRDFNIPYHAINLSRRIISYPASSSQPSTGLTPPLPPCDLMQEHPFHSQPSYYHPMNNMLSLLGPPLGPSLDPPPPMSYRTVCLLRRRFRRPEWWTRAGPSLGLPSGPSFGSPSGPSPNRPFAPPLGHQQQISFLSSMNNNIGSMPRHDYPRMHQNMSAAQHSMYSNNGRLSSTSQSTGNTSDSTNPTRTLDEILTNTINSSTSSTNIFNSPQRQNMLKDHRFQAILDEVGTPPSNQR
ncbi:unnamed protein product, partial [Rotaria sordida]